MSIHVSVGSLHTSGSLLGTWKLLSAEFYVYLTHTVSYVSEVQLNPFSPGQPGVSAESSNSAEPSKLEITVSVAPPPSSSPVNSYPGGTSYESPSSRQWLYNEITRSFPFEISTKHPTNRQKTNTYDNETRQTDKTNANEDPYFFLLLHPRHHGNSSFSTATHRCSRQTINRTSWSWIGRGKFAMPVLSRPIMLAGKRRSRSLQLNRRL